MTEEQIIRRFRDLFPDYTRGAENLSPYFDIFEAGIEVATKELQKELEDTARDRRNMCKHKYFINDVANNNMAVICHTLLDCEHCTRYKE